jgi:hypothetical protein
MMVKKRWADRENDYKTFFEFYYMRKQDYTAANNSDRKIRNKCVDYTTFCILELSLQVSKRQRWTDA